MQKNLLMKESPALYSSWAELRERLDGRTDNLDPRGERELLGNDPAAEAEPTADVGTLPFSVGDRINKRVRRELAEGRDPIAQAEPLMWDWDRLVPTDNPANLAYLLALESETLHNKTAGGISFPIQPSQMQDDPMARAILQTETFSEFLSDLYQ